MLDGTIPPELQNKYLNIILFETERLTKLTQGILDLNRFGQHRGMMLDLTDFDINRMIKTTILTFEGTCSAKGLSFDLVLTGQKLYVHGDMSKIQQVLYNLIDNATKFSHNDASIKIETSIKNEKVLISVKDSGIGIPAESIKKIWDRFYKTDLSRGQKGNRAGTFHYKRNYPGAQRKYQRHQHRRSGNRVHLYPATRKKRSTVITDRTSFFSQW